MRRPSLLVGIAVLTVVLAGCTSNWPMFGWNATGSRSSSDTSITLSDVAGATPNRVWTDVTSRFVYSSPAVVNGVVYITADDQKLYAFDATGAGCTGSPKACAPLWTAATGGSVSFSSPAVANGVVYVGSADGKLYAFDAAGTTNCSGGPKTCRPLWTAATGGAIDASAVVANGVVYIGADDDNVYAFDAAGTTNCSGSPKTCTPLWTATTGDAIRSTPAVANGTLYVGSDQLYAFDAAGTTNCSGSPKTCTPLWTATTASRVSGVAVAGGKVYVGAGSLFPSPFGVLYAFDAAGHTHCNFTTQCLPLWRGGLTGAPSAPAVANGVVYIAELGGPLRAFDANGSTGCTGGICEPLWSGSVGGEGQASSPAVANGVVYIGGGGSSVVGFMLAFDAAGTMGCSGTPKICNPVWTSDNGFGAIASSPAVANGYAYIGGTNGVAAFHFG